MSLTSITKLTIMHKFNYVLLSLFSLCLTACNNDFIDIKKSEHTRIYKDDEALACSNQNTISLKVHGKELIDKNIELHCSQKGHDGYSYTESCDSETGTINIFTIHRGDLSAAKQLGFSSLNNLPDAQFDNQCEFKVISDNRKYGLLNQLNDQQTIWLSNKSPDYTFVYNQSFTDCPTFAPTPTVEVTVINNEISTILDTDKQTFLTDFSGYMTIDELFSELHLQLELTPREAGIHAGEPKEIPTFHQIGAPKQYFIDAGRSDCDAANYDISHIEIN